VRDKLIKSPTVARIKAEEERKKERIKRWEKAVAIFKKKTELVPSTKLMLTSQKGSTLASVVSSLPAQDKFPKGDTSQESLEGTRLAEEETDPEGRQKK